MHICVYIYTLQGTLCPCPTLGKRNIYKLCRLVGDMLLFRRDFVFNLHTVRWYMGADASKDIMDLFLDFEDVFGFSLAGDVWIFLKKKVANSLGKSDESKNFASFLENSIFLETRLRSHHGFHRTSRQGVSLKPFNESHPRILPKIPNLHGNKKTLTPQTWTGQNSTRCFFQTKTLALCQMVVEYLQQKGAWKLFLLWFFSGKQTKWCEKN